MKQFFIFMSFYLLITLPFSISAGAPTCQLYNSKPYCSYSGKVKRIYVNSSGTVLLYYDTPLDLSSAQSVGYNPTSESAAVVKISDNPEFAKLFYSTALSAQATKRSISMQMRNVWGGYLIADRIWLSE